ncbi:hypothetical protein SAMN05444354_1079 [Stigmatella aurantiaca]|uniref:Uncharacterized protein n=1 Tax=Stigmatella aurantiaca TaxID=41 RepID=A0A1H7RF16_STIAU|nr:hypothetical protein SAMN05444354_1079 [Stigmatella aurantiaca]
MDQPGIPRSFAELSCQKRAAPRLKLSQARFLPAGSPGTATQTWTVPVCVRAGTGKASSRTCMLLAEAASEVELPVQGCPSWILLNAGGSGYYRVGSLKEGRSRGWKRRALPLPRRWRSRGRSAYPVWTGPGC